MTDAIRVCVTGAECTGKTTLATALGEHYGAPVIPEYGREYFAEKLARGDASVYAADVLKVVNEQSRREREAAPGPNGLIICDTDAFTVSVWHERWLGERRPEIDAIIAQHHANGCALGLYLLTSPDIPFVPDGMRSSAELRRVMHALYRERLTETGCPWIEVRGSRGDRLAAAIKQVDWLLGTS